MAYKKSFWRKIFSGMSILSLLLNSVLPYGLLTTVYAQESTTSATQQLASPTPTETPSPTPTDTPIPTPTDTPTSTPTPTPTPPAEQDLDSFDTTIATPSATPNPTLTITPEPTPEATPSATPTPEQGQILDGVSTESAGLKQGKVSPRKAGDLMKKPKQQANQDYVEGEVIVKFKKNKLDIKSFFGKARAFVFEKRHSLEKRDEMKTSNTQVFKSKKSTDDMVKELKSDANVEYAEPNYRRDLTTILSNDTYKDTLWGLDNTGQTVKGSAGTSDADINAPEAWNISESSSNVIVAIIDTGVAYNHPDLQANMWDGSNCKDENGLALNNCNHGYDFEDNDKTPLPGWSSHGTHVAGIIAAAKNNAKGIIGIAPTTKIMALKFGLTVATEVKAIDFAIQNGAKIINASFGGGPYSQSEYDAINRFKTAGGIYVAAAGNGGSDGIGDNNENTHNYPSDYDLDNIISVAATDKNDEPAVFTNYGTTSVDVGAPGVDINSTIVDIQTPEVLSESFDSLTPPEVPNNWDKTGNWGTFNTEDEFWGNVLYGDLNRPYNNSTDSTITSPTYNLSGTSGYMGFWAVCDTQYNTDSWHDYMALEMSGNGTDFTEIQRWDEASLDTDTDENNNTDGKTINYLSSRIPLNLLTDSFKFRLRWITDSEGTGATGDGCHVDDIYIFKYTIDSSEMYDYYSGTSMAAPHVVGLTALIEGYNSSLTAAQVKNIILTTGDPITNAADKPTVTGKRINAYQALLASAPLSSAKVITSFTVPGQTGSTVINESAHTIGITVPFGTDVTALVPTITTTGVSVNPASGVAQNFTNPVPYIVIAPDSSTQAYTVTVIVSDDPIATAFDGISAMLAGSPNNVANNLNNVTTANISNFSGLYFEKFINGIPVGKLTFNGPLNLSNNETKTFLQNLGTKLEQGEGRIALDARESTVFAASGASLVMYDMPRITYSQLIVRDDTDTILNSTDIIESFTQNPTTGDISFDTAHFTQFDIDMIKPVIAAHANIGPVEATSESGAVVTYSAPLATDNIDPTAAANCLLVSGSTFSIGSTTVTCTKTDTAGNQATPTTFTVTVTANSSPSFSVIADESVGEDASSQQISITNISPGPTGEAGQTVTMSATSSDTAIIPNPSISGSGSTRTLTYAPAADTHGSVTITVVADDGQTLFNTYSRTFTITVNSVNDAPSFDPIANQTVNEDASSQNLSITNVSPGSESESDQTVSLSATSSNTSIVPSPSVSGSGATRTLSYAPTANAYGSVTVTVTADDGQASNNTFTRTFTITVNPVNDTPSFTKGSDQNISEDAGLQTVSGWATNIGKGSSNESDQTHNFIVTNNNNALFSAQPAVAANGTLTYTPAANANGSATVTVSLHDDGGTANGGHDTSATQTFVITVNLVNDAPVADNVTVTTDEDTTKNITLNAADIDLPTQTINYFLVTNPTHGTLDAIADGKINYTPSTNYNGEDSFTYKANDGVADSNTATVSITVNAVADPTVLSPIGNKTVDELTTLSFTATATDPDNSITYSLTNAPSGATINSTTGVFSFTPTEAQGPGTYTLTVNATDGTSTDSEEIIITVNEVNVAPTANDVSVSTNEDTTKNITLSASDSDIPVQTLTYSVVTNPSHGTLGTASGNQITYTPNVHYSGTDSFTFKANDGTDDSNTATVTITIQDVTSPTVTKLGDNSIDVTLPIGSMNLVFSEMLSNDSKIAVQNALTAGADKALSFSWTGGVVAITATETTTFTNDVVVNISDVAGNTATGLVLVDSSLTAVQTTPNPSGAATVDATTPQVVITNPTQAVEVTISAGTTDPTINVSSFVNDGTGDIPQITINSDTADIAIPATTVTGPADWNGVIAAPTVTTVTLPEISGETKTFSAGIEIGFTDGKLSFDEAVRILLPGQAGKRAGYSRPGTAFTEITSICAADNQATGNALAVDGECRIDSGLDLVIWTKHFTKFASYTQTTNSTSTSGSSSSSSSTSSSGGSVSAPVCNDTKPGSAPALTGVSNGTNSITLTWSAAANPVSYYLITYGLTSGAQTWGNPNVGGSGTSSYTINGLSGGTKYYFKVRAGNGCAPGDYSNELSGTPGGGFVSVPAEGFAEGVLGASTTIESTQPLIEENTLRGKDAIPSTSNEGQVLGVQQGVDRIKWLGLGTLFIILSGVVLVSIRKRMIM